MIKDLSLLSLLLFSLTVAVPDAKGMLADRTMSFSMTSTSGKDQTPNQAFNTIALNTPRHLDDIVSPFSIRKSFKPLFQKASGIFAKDRKGDKLAQIGFVLLMISFLSFGLAFFYLPALFFALACYFAGGIICSIASIRTFENPRKQKLAKAGVWLFIIPSIAFGVVLLFLLFDFSN